MTGGKSKFGIYTNKIYTSIFKEKADEYRDVLNLSQKEKIRDTMYSEVLDIISSYELGLADVLKKEFEKKGAKLTSSEANKIFSDFEQQKTLLPFIKKARNKMASRDYEFREALHLKLYDYITPITQEDYDKFLGEKSKELLERIDKLTHLFFSVCQFHCFENGNKRMAIVISADFLLLNGYTFYLDRFFSESENISIHVAAGNISKEFLHRIFEALFNNKLESDENIKLEYYNAINKKEVAYL